VQPIDKRWIFQDRDVDGLLSKMLSVEGQNIDRATFLKIFQTIDKNADGVCDIDELTVCNAAPLEVPAALIC
jgi:hypothetical protein